MFSLFSGLCTHLTKYSELKIQQLGLSGSGKTTLLNQIKKQQGLKFQERDRIKPTKGLNLGKFNYNKFALTIWDLSGDKNYLTIWKNYYEDCDCLQFVIDGCDQEKIEDLNEILKLFSEEPSLQTKPIHFIQNKNDLENFNSLNFIDLISKHFDFSNSNRSVNEMNAFGRVELDAIIEFNKYL